MFPVLLLSGILLGSGVQPHAPNVPAAVILKPQVVNVTQVSVSPASLSFTAANPDSSPLVAGSSSAVVTWKTTGGSVTSPWTLRISSPDTFSSCATVPASAVTVSCASITGGSGATCGGASTLSSSAVQIANGLQSNGSTTYSVSLTFTLQDSWKYIASSLCALTVSYTVTAN